MVDGAESDEPLSDVAAETRDRNRGGGRPKCNEPEPVFSFLETARNQPQAYQASIREARWVKYKAIPFALGGKMWRILGGRGREAVSSGKMVLLCCVGGCIDVL